MDRAVTALLWLTWIPIILLLLGGVALSSINLLAHFSGQLPYVVLSGSMEPTIPVGAVAVVQPRLPPQQIDAGDVITFVVPGDLVVTHRVAAVTFDERGRAFVTKGDANRVRDADLVRPANLLGRVERVVPFGGYFLVYAKPQLFVPYVIAILLALVTLRGARAFVRRRLATVAGLTA